jgi:ABC-type transport system involved in multi-copper enzyme maturation permease subunit
MLLGPIFTVELITSARRTRYFALRAVYAGLLLAVLAAVYLYHAWEPEPGKVANCTATFFVMFTRIQLVAVLALTPAVTAGTIAIERQRRTIEYLFASPLSNREIVLDKLAARLVHAICLVLAGVPVLALAMLLGGIAPEALAALLLLTVSSVLTVAIFSITVSVWSARPGEAVVRAYLALLTLLILPEVINGLDGKLPWLDAINDQILAANPLHVFGNVVSQASSKGVSEARTLVLALVRNQLLAAGVMLVAAIAAVRRVHLRQIGAPKRKPRRWWPGARAAVGDNPMLWKERFTEPGTLRLGWIGIVLVSLVVLSVLAAAVQWYLNTTGPSAGYAGRGYSIFAALTATAIGCGATVLVAVRAAGSITSERDRECWDSLLTTPLEGWEILRAKIFGSIWATRGDRKSVV